jgi:hypothetical protein
VLLTDLLASDETTVELSGVWNWDSVLWASLVVMRVLVDGIDDETLDEITIDEAIERDVAANVLWIGMLEVRVSVEIDGSSEAWLLELDAGMLDETAINDDVVVPGCTMELEGCATARLLELDTGVPDETAISDDVVVPGGAMELEGSSPT